MATLVPHRSQRVADRTDERIREDVSERLFLDPWIDASELEVQVHDGTVTLVGEVDTREQRWHAEDLAWSVRGVRDVFSHVKLRGAIVVRREVPVLHATDPTPLGINPRRMAWGVTGLETGGTGRRPRGSS